MLGCMAKEKNMNICDCVRLDTSKVLESFSITAYCNRAFKN